MPWDDSQLASEIDDFEVKIRIANENGLFKGHLKEYNRITGYGKTITGKKKNGQLLYGVRRWIASRDPKKWKAVKHSHMPNVPLMGTIRKTVILLAQPTVLLLHGLFSGLGLDKAHVKARRMFD